MKKTAAKASRKTTISNTAIFKISILLLTTFQFPNAHAQNITDKPLAAYESGVRQFKPKQNLDERNYNDIRQFVYEWFTHFEHASTVDFYLDHLDSKHMEVSFPGQKSFNNHADFAGWYNNLLTQTLWNFHDLSKVQVKHTAPQQYLVSFIVDWYGEVKSSSDQLAGWQSRKDSYLYHYTLRQTWKINDADHKLLIQKLTVTGGDTSSPIIE